MKHIKLFFIFILLTVSCENIDSSIPSFLEINSYEIENNNQSSVPHSENEPYHLRIKFHLQWLLFSILYSSFSSSHSIYLYDCEEFSVAYGTIISYVIFSPHINIFVAIQTQLSSAFNISNTNLYMFVFIMM